MKHALTLSLSTEESEVNWDQHESCFLRVTPRVSSEKLKSFPCLVLKGYKLLSILITLNCQLNMFNTNYFATFL